ncbi:HDIG domain-containing protein [Patescibacteria group bacterium]|nr:HDIG domain-containing protein [Patescibacteria group bacterium]
MYLRVAPELYLKRLIVGGFEKVYEIGRQFRNEGVDHQHNPEFTSCEFYWAYQDYEGLMNFTEEMLSEIIKKVTGSLVVEYEDQKLDFSLPWKRHKFAELIKEETGVDIMKTKDEKELKEIIQEKGYQVDKNAGWAKMVDDFYKVAVRDKLIQPCFVTDYPLELEPLAKKKEDNPELVQRFQLLVVGLEIIKAYTELNDPIDQMDRFKKQQELREKGDDEAQFIDEDFVTSLEYGLPPTAGWGMGIDRLVALLTNSHSLREVILFPTMKPVEQKTVSTAEKSQSSKKKNESKNVEANITRDEALEFIKGRVKNENSLKHMLATEAIMKGLAKEFDQNEEIWGLAGLLHDSDMEIKEAQTDMSKHGTMGADELKAKGVSEVITSAIKAHNEATGEPRDTLIKQAIYAADPLTGLIVTTALVRPDKKINSVKLKSLKKKFKDKSFAKGAKREAIMSCEEFGLPLDKFLEIGLSSMQKIADELDL